MKVTFGVVAGCLLSVVLTLALSLGNAAAFVVGAGCESLGMLGGMIWDSGR